MNYQIIEKSLLLPTMSVIGDLSLIKKKEITENIGVLFTLYRAIDSKLEIGFTKEKKSLSEYANSNSFKIVATRVGTQRESNLLLLTLKEIGYNQNIKDGSFDYSIQLINQLGILGWPVGSYNKSLKKKFSY